MSRMKTETKSGLTKVATGAVAAVGAVAAMGGGPAATALAAALPSIGEAFLGVFSRRAKKLTELFAEELLSDGGFQAFVDAPSETAHLLLETNPQQAELIARVVRELVNAPSEKAARPLAFLVREYDRAGRTEVDEYFRER